MFRRNFAFVFVGARVYLPPWLGFGGHILRATRPHRKTVTKLWRLRSRGPILRAILPHYLKNDMARYATDRSIMNISRVLLSNHATTASITPTALRGRGVVPCAARSPPRQGVRSSIWPRRWPSSGSSSGSSSLGLWRRLWRLGEALETRPERPYAKRSISACASAISGISGVGEKPSSAGLRMARASAGRPVD